MTIVGGEEPVMRAREVLARIAGDAVLDVNADGYYHVSACLAAMLTFADEGSGIGELREALRPYLQHRTDCRNRLRMGQRNCSCGLTEILTAPAPKEQIAENANCSGERFAEDLAYVAEKPVEDGWLPIELAPKDTEILVYMPDEPEHVGRIHRAKLAKTANGHSWFIGHHFRFDCTKPTYFRPLPSPPDIDRSGLAQEVE